MTELKIYQSQLPALQEQFVTQFTPQKCLMVFNKVNSPALCMQSQAPTLAGIKKQYSDDFVIAYIALWIDNLNDFVNASRKMSPVQIEETAIIIFQEYYYFNLADINLVFRKIKKGEFGQLFAELDGVKILSWFEAYARERMHTAADASISAGDGYKEDLPRQSDRSADNIKNLQAKGLFIHIQAKNPIE